MTWRRNIKLRRVMKFGGSSVADVEKMKNVAVIYAGEDLDVLLELCDRIMVLCGGQVSGIVDGRTTTKEEVGLLMTRFVKEAIQNDETT